MRGDAVADAGRWRLAWHSPAHLERIVCVACHKRCRRKSLSRRRRWITRNRFAFSQSAELWIVANFSKITIGTSKRAKPILTLLCFETDCLTEVFYRLVALS